MNTPRPVFHNRPQRVLTSDALTGVGGNRPCTISRNGNRFTLIDTAGNEQMTALVNQAGEFYLDLVVVDANKNKSRQFYLTKYKKDEPRPPDCWSDNGIGPSNLAINPQSPTCAACPNSGWNGPNPPLCSSLKKLAVIVVGDPKELVYEFTVKAGSWSGERGWTNYCNTLSQHGVDICDLVTRVSFVLDSNGILAFENGPQGFLDDELIHRVEAAWASNTARICGMEDVARDPSLPITLKPAAMEAPPVPKGQLPPPPVPVAPQQGRPELVTQVPEKRRPGRPPKTEPQRSPPVSGNGGQALEVPPFLQKPPAASPAATPAQFGIQKPEEAPEDLMKAINQAFNLPPNE